jgi:formate hydrogenlyase transcriptional activator
MGKQIDKIPDEAMEALVRWRWPGNICELEDLLERAVILTRGTVLYVPLAELETMEEEEERTDTEAALPENPNLRLANGPQNTSNSHRRNPG